MPVVLFVDDLGAVHHAPAPEAYRVADPKQLQQWMELCKQGAQEKHAEPRGSSWATSSNQEYFGTKNINTPSPVTSNIQPPFPACPVSTYTHRTEGLLAVPDAALSIIMQYLDKQSQLQLSYSCKAMTTAVFTRQQQQASLVIEDHDVKWCALLKVLSWLPVTAWRLGYKDASLDPCDTTRRHSENLLDRILGWEDCFLGCGYAAMNNPVTSKALLQLWNSYFSVSKTNSQWRTPLEHPSVASVTLQGMSLSFLVPSALIIACPNMLQLTLVACSVDVPCVGDGEAGSICSSLTELHLNRTHVYKHYQELTPVDISRGLPNVRKLTMESSIRAEALAGALISQLEVLEHDTFGSGLFGQSCELFGQLTPKVLAGLPKLHTLNLSHHRMTGAQLTMLEHMPALRKLAVFGFEFEYDEDYHQQHTHLTSLHMYGSTLELTTLGRLPLHSLKNDPINRECLKVELPYHDSIAATARAIRNLKSCCSFPIAVESLSLETNRNDNYKEEVHAAMLLDMLTTFKVGTELSLKWLVFGDSFTSILGKLNISNIKSLYLEGCEPKGNYDQFWQHLLQHLPNVTKITLKRTEPSKWVMEEIVTVIEGYCKAYASVQHKQPLAVTVGPSIPDLNVSDILPRNLPPKLSVSICEGSFEGYKPPLLPTEWPSALGLGLGLDTGRYTLPAVVALIKF